MKRLLKESLFLLPIFIIPLSVNRLYIDQRDARELFFLAIVINTLAIIINNVWIRYFLIWVGLNWWLHFFLPIQSSEILFNVVFGFFLFYAIKNYIEEKDIDRILKIVCWTVLFQVFWLGIQALGKDFIFYPIDIAGNRQSGRVELNGWLGNKDVLGIYLAMTLPLFRVYYKKLILFVLLGLFVARCSVAFVAGISGLVCFEVLKVMQNRNLFKFVIIILTCLIMGVLFFVFRDRFGMERIDIWKKMITQTLNWRCLIGQGLGKFMYLRVLDKTGTWWENPHNEFLQVYFELGIIGIFLVFGYLADLFRRFVKSLKDERIMVLFSGVVVLLISSIGMFPMQLATTAFLGITYFALLENLLCRQIPLLKRD